MNQEVNNKKICKSCGQEKIRNLVGKFNSKDKKYHDENGKTWNGHVCPSCHKENIKMKIKLSRALKKSIV